MSCTIDHARPEDWSSMVETFCAAGRAAWGHILSAESLEALAPPDRWREAISLDSYAVFVVRTADGVRGFSAARASGDADALPSTGEVDSFYTHPSVWRMGYGRELMAATVAYLAERFTDATLWTEVRNERPRRFYESLGWTLDGAERRREVRGSEIVEVRYRRASSLSRKPSS